MPIWTFSPPVKIQFLTGRDAQNLLDTPVRLRCVQLRCRPGYSASPQTSAAHNSHSYIYNNITKIPNRQKKSSIFIGESCAVLGFFFMLHIFWGKHTNTHTLGQIEAIGGNIKYRKRKYLGWISNTQKSWFMNIYIEICAFSRREAIVCSSSDVSCLTTDFYSRAKKAVKGMRGAQHYPPGLQMSVFVNHLPAQK